MSEVEAFMFTDAPEFLELRRKLLRWSADHATTLAEAKPALPPGLGNRAAANWRLLLAIADHAAGDWSKRARSAAIQISRKPQEMSIGLSLLEALRGLRAKGGNRESIASATIVQALIADKDSEWCEYKGRGSITQRQVAALLKNYRIFPRTIHPTGKADASPRGYAWRDFDDAFARFAARSAHPHTGPAKEAEIVGFATPSVRMCGSEDLIMTKRKIDWSPGMTQRASLEGEQVYCLTSDEGHLWIHCYDQLPRVVRQRLASSSFNICPACLDIAVRERARGASPTTAAYLVMIVEIEKKLRS